MDMSMQEQAHVLMAPSMWVMLGTHAMYVPHLLQCTVRAHMDAFTACMQVHDIEELSSACSRAKLCPYYAARELAGKAELVFCPYRRVYVRDGCAYLLHGRMTACTAAKVINMRRGK